jgi:hypothetical protein
MCHVQLSGSDAAQGGAGSSEGIEIDLTKESRVWGVRDMPSRAHGDGVPREFKPVSGSVNPSNSSSSS